MVSGHIKVSNQYKELLGIGMKQSGQYKMSEESWIKRNGVYQKFLDKSIPPEPEIIAGASIHTLLGSPTTPGDYTWVNYNVMQATTQGGVGLTTGVFPAGSTLTIINHGDIAGGGGNGNGGNGGDALVLQVDTIIDNRGRIWGGGGGGGGDIFGGGGGGAGRPEGIGASGPNGVGGKGGSGSYGAGGGGGGYYSGAINGGNASGLSPGGGGTNGGSGGAPGGNGTSGSTLGGGGGGGGVGGNGGQVGGTAGFAVRKNGYNLTWISGNTAPNVYGNIG